MSHIDLHCHSNASDGSLTPTQVVERAHQRGATLLALTDHDCLDGLAEARSVAEKLNLAFVDGVEISVTWRDVYSIHIVGLGIDINNAALLQNLENVRQGRLTRLQKMSDELEKFNIHGVYAGALKLATNQEMVGRAHVARFLVSQGVCKTHSEVFRRFISRGKPGYVKHEWAQLDNAISWINNAGGIAVIAHPGRYELKRNLMTKLITEFKDAGGCALEVSSASHSLDERLLFARYARDFALESSAGSDFHIIGEYGHEVGMSPDLPEICLPVWQTRWIKP